MSRPAVRALVVVLVLAAAGGSRTTARAAVIGAGDAAVREGAAPHVWVHTDAGAGTSLCGAWMRLRFAGTRRVVLLVDTAHLVLPAAARHPILAWTIDGGPEQSRRLAAGDTAVTLVADSADPAIDVWVKGMSPFEDRFRGDRPPNSVWIRGFEVDDGCRVEALPQPEPVWLGIGDSIMSGDGAALAEKQGRPANDDWAASDDPRASWGWLLAGRYGLREARLATGGYNWKGGLAAMPDVATLVDRRTSTVSRLEDGLLRPAPAVVVVNLGTNGRPADAEVIASLTAIRRRSGAAAKVVVMVPVSGAARAEVTRAFAAYKEASGDPLAFLVDLGRFDFATADGVHPTAAGHRAIAERAAASFDEILGPPPAD